MTGAKKPTHVLKIKVKDSPAKANVGVGWANDDGSMSISLNPGTILDWRDPVTINLFPWDRRPSKKSESSGSEDEPHFG